MALLAEDAFDLVGQERKVSWGFITVIPPKCGFSLAAMDEVRTLMFQILRSQDITLSSRLKITGRFCEQLAELVHNRQIDALPGLLESMEGELESGAAMAPLASHAELPDVQAQIIAPFLLAGRQSFQSPHVQ